MKKLLFVLLFPLLSYGQNVQAFLEMYNNSTGELLTDEVFISEGDTLRLELHMVLVGSDDFNAMSDVKYLFGDLNYSSEFLSPIANAFTSPAIDNLGDSNAFLEYYDFANVKYSDTGITNLQGSYNSWESGLASYLDNSSMSVKRIAVQLSNKSFQEIFNPTTYRTDIPVFDMLFVVKPGAEAQEVIPTWLTLATMENTSGLQVTSLYSQNPVYNINVAPAVTYNAKLHFVLPPALDPTNFRVSIESNIGTDTLNSTEPSDFQFQDYVLDAAGDVILFDVEIDKPYYVYTLIPISGAYLADVHTITDAYRSFKYLTDVGINGNSPTYDNFGVFSADVNLDGQFNSADTYGLLGYVLGLEVGDNFCLPQEQDGELFHGCTAAVLYENYTVDKLGVAVGHNNSGTEPTEETRDAWSGEFTPSTNTLEFNFAFWHHGDLDQSHSTSFPANIASKAAKAGINLSTKAVSTINFDMVSRIEDGKVYVDLDYKSGSVVGLQARVKYDTSKLTLDEVLYDTGNTVTNFAKYNAGNLLIGALSKDGSEQVKKGTPFTIVFDTNGDISNLTGLFYFDNTDAVRANGDKVNLNIR